MKRGKKQTKVQKKATTQGQTKIGPLEGRLSCRETNIPTVLDTLIGNQPPPQVGETVSYGLGFKPALFGSALEHVRRGEDIQPILIQFICSECKEIVYKSIFAVGYRGDYKKVLAEIEAQIFNEEFPRRHSSGVYENEKMKKQNLPSGFAFCGYLQIVSLWRLWEAPIDDNQSR